MIVNNTGAGTVHVGGPDQLRDWFAGMALQGIVSFDHEFHDKAADEAYRYADAMIQAREREPGE